MTSRKQATKTIPGKPFDVKVEPIVPTNAADHLTSGTIAASFKTVENLLSSKPLRRPNRTRPIR